MGKPENLKEKEENGEEPPTTIQLRNRHVQTTETMIRNWVMYSKLLIQRLGRPQTHKLIDMAADRARLEPDENGNLVEKSVTAGSKEYREIENKIVEQVIGDDDKLLHDKKVFFEDA